ncbi:MAG: 1-deoxy-D-xylulose-5-phosphate synthase [Actinomadura sp.]
MSVLATIRGPEDVKALDPETLPGLAEEIRAFMIEAVARTGGHLGPNLGVVELTIALHRVFDSPRDRIVFDVGHQAYVHKLLTGRQDFSGLRQAGGLSGYPSRAESEHDLVENQHASVALSWADGLAAAQRLTGRDGHVVAVVGDGALTGGMAWEALNNIAAAPDRPLVIVVNDNQHSYSPTVGGFAALRGAKKGLKDSIAPQCLFEDLGLKYLGPIDGHDEAAVESALRKAKDFAGPVIVHCITHKGRGYAPAEQADERFHQVKVIDPDTGRPISAAGRDWTSVFGEEMVRLGAERDDIVAITAAMKRSTGLEAFARRYPDRFFDVGIAEQHAAASAAAMATAGLHPVVAVYATFLNRCFDQILMDVALHRCGVTFALDRAGITGDDGASHNGMWDLAILQAVPGLRIAAPRDAGELRAQLREAVAVDDAPTVVRYSKGAIGPVIPAIGRVGGMDVLRGRTEGLADVLIVAIGALAPTCLDAADRLTAQGVTTTVIDPRWIRPLDERLPALAARHRLVITVEDGIRTPGIGTMIAQALRDADADVALRTFGVPTRFLDHATRDDVLAQVGLTAADITRQTTAALRRPSWSLTRTPTDDLGSRH